MKTFKLSDCHIESMSCPTEMNWIPLKIAKKAVWFPHMMPLLLCNRANIRFSFHNDTGCLKLSTFFIPLFELQFHNIPFFHFFRVDHLFRIPCIAFQFTGYIQEVQMVNQFQSPACAGTSADCITLFAPNDKAVDASTAGFNWGALSAAEKMLFVNSHITRGELWTFAFVFGLSTGWRFVKKWKHRGGVKGERVFLQLYAILADRVERVLTNMLRGEHSGDYQVQYPIF